MAVQITQQTFLYELGAIYDGEKRFLDGQQEMLTQATDVQLRGALQTHIDQTRQHIVNLEQVFGLLGQPTKGVTSDGARGLVDEAKKAMKESKDTGPRDYLIDGAADKVEHFEIASYNGLLVAAQGMGPQQVVEVLRQNQQQEQQTAQTLEQMAPRLMQAAQQEEGASALGASGAAQAQSPSSGAPAQSAAPATAGKTSAAPTQSAATPDKTSAAGTTTADPYVVVNVPKGSDILIDNTRTPVRAND